MATHDHTRNPSALSRRQALASTAAIGALALPAGAAVAASGTQSDEPLIAMWAERMQAKAAADAGEYGPDEDDLVDRLVSIEGRIAETTPISLEGLAIVATILLDWSRKDGSPEDVAGVTVARYILDTTPADVLVRAGVA